MDEDAIYEEVRDLYARGGIDGVLALEQLRSMAGCRALADLGQEIRFSEPDESAACMACADLLASRLGSGETGERELEDFRCEMALELVWSRIDLKQTAAAEAALARAARCFLEGTRSPALKGKLLDTWTVLHGTRGDFDKARQAARAALALYEQIGERHDQGRILYRMSIIEEEGGKEKMEESLRLVSEALSRLDSAAEPDLYLSAVHRQAICLIDLGRFREARVRLFESLGHLREHGDEAHEILRATLNGQINAAIGNLDAAERDLFDGLLGVSKAGLGYIFGLLALDLCAVYFDQGRTDEAGAAGLKTVEVFRSLSLPAGGQRAMLFLEMALQDGLADADLLRRTSRYMHELLNDPDARFRPRA
jgi:tetratricopeptide (TPR) repeat protein